jgi:hypothetical protein
MLSKLMVELCRLSYGSAFEKCELQKNVQLQNICVKYNIEIDDIVCIKNNHTMVNIIKSAHCCIVVFKGTDDIFDFIADINFFPKKTSMGVVHRGFYNTFLKIYPDIREHLDGLEKKIFLTGHSLGAALAVLCSAYFKHLNPTLVTFGSPRVGAKSFTNYVAKDIVHIRWENSKDVVCSIPPIFVHFGEKRPISFGSFVCKNHGSKYYKKMIITKCLDYYENEII